MTDQVLSYGGGVQSVAMCVLVARGILERPDYIVCADTGREATSTWDYLDEVMQPFLERHGLRVDIASHDLSTVDLYSHKGKVLMPCIPARGNCGHIAVWSGNVVLCYVGCERKTCSRLSSGSASVWTNATAPH
jgi:3'-phosphoadenosine 5'-phosphosulfate sulfotransferase (PAPS reductase)/FAD synthetase